MKKTTLIFILIILFFCTTTYAENYTIRFSGLDWYITPEEAMEQMIKKGYTFNHELYTTNESEWDAFYGSEPYQEKNVKISHSYYWIELKNQNKFVAGYKIENIWLRFFPTCSIENKTIGKPYRLIRAIYEFAQHGTQNEIADLYNDLTIKLTDLYGEPSFHGKSFGNRVLEAIGWFAEDGTGVVLFQEPNLFTSDIRTPHLLYGIINDKQMISDYLSIKRSTNKNNNYDGL